MHHVHAALSQQRDVCALQLGHVHGNQLVVQHAGLVQPLQRSQAEFPLGMTDLPARLQHVHVDAHAALAGHLADARQRGVADAVRRMGRQRHAQQRVIAQLIGQSLAAAQGFCEIAGPRIRRFQHRYAEGRAESGIARACRGHLGEEVIVVEAGLAAANHLGERQPAAVADELRAHPAPLCRPDVLVEPDLQVEVVGPTAQQVHGRMGMRIDQAGDQRMGVQQNAFRVAGTLERLGTRPAPRDAPVLDQHAMAVQHLAPGPDRHHVAGQQQRAGGTHAVMITPWRGTRIRRCGCPRAPLRLPARTAARAPPHRFPAWPASGRHRRCRPSRPGPSR